MPRRHYVQIRASDEELAVLRANAGSEGVGPYLRRLGLEAGPVIHSTVTKTGEVLAVTDVTERPTRLEGKRTVSTRAANSGRPSGQAGSTPAPSVSNGEPFIAPPADEDSGGSDVPQEGEDFEDQLERENRVVRIGKDEECPWTAEQLAQKARMPVALARRAIDAGRWKYLVP